MTKTTLTERIDNYLQNGGLFNPEIMEHDKVRDLLIDCRTELAALKTRESTPIFCNCYTMCDLHSPSCPASGESR